MSQFLEVIEWFDSTGEEIVHRIPESGSGETKYGAQLVIRENQAALFFRDGKALDVFGPGRHTLTSKNLPILTKVLSLPWGFTSPFRCEVLFVNQKIFTNMRWGTKEPVVFKDSELGLVRLRAFGSFTMKIDQPLLFINTMVGTQGAFDTSHVEDYLREVIVSRLNDFLGEFVDTILALPRSYDEMAEAVKEKLGSDFGKYGMELVDFFINRITPPEEVQRMIDERSGMQAVGNLDAFLKFRTAKAIGDAGAGGAGGMAAEGMGMGVGAGLGMMIPGMLYQSLDSTKKDVVNCPECHGELAPDSRFCAHCGHQMVVIKKCPRCSKNVTTTAKFCSACGFDLGGELKCAKCQAKLLPGSKFCTHCGEKTEA